MKKVILSLIFFGLILCPALCFASPSVELINKFTAADTGSLETRAEYGASVALSSEALAVAAPFEGIEETGAVYVYSRDKGGPGNWGFVKKITLSDLGVVRIGSLFGKTLAISDDYLMISDSDGDYDGVRLAGVVYVFGRNKGGDNNWGLLQVLHAEPPVLKGYFGSSVAISGDTLVVGYENLAVGSLQEVGCAYVYTPDRDNPGQWKLQKVLEPQNKEGVVENQAGLKFGSSVGVAGDILAVGAPRKIISWPQRAGMVYIFSRNAGGANNWGIVKRVSPQFENGDSDIVTDMEFGAKVDVSGDLLLVGAPQWSTEHVDYVGSSYVFSKDKGGADQWGIVKRLMPVRENGNIREIGFSEFGKDVSISGDLALVASKYGAYLFSKSQSDIGTWGIVKTINDIETEPDSKLASSVAIHGDYSLIGSGAKDVDSKVGAGAVYYFKTPNIISLEGCADKTVSPTATQPTGTRAIVTSVAKRVKTTAEIKKEHQTPGMGSMLGANEYEFTASVTAGKVAYFCFNSSSLGERKAEEVALFKLFPNKDSKSFTYS
ncbi:hypothetical protein D0S45_20190, partial [Marinifilum sp. JC120]